MNEQLQTVWGDLGDFPRTPHVALGGFPCDSPYLRACLDGRDLYALLMEARWFLRLPPVLRQACLNSRAWLRQHAPDSLGADLVAQGWYDEAGHELDPVTRQPLTEEELLQLSGALDGAPLGEAPDDLAVAPPDPARWVAVEVDPLLVSVALVDRAGLTVEQILSDIASRGRDRTAAAYGVPVNWLERATSDADLARTILDMDGKPWP